MPRVQAIGIKYDDPVEFSVEIAVDRIENLLSGEYNLSKRAVALLLLQDDEEMAGLVKQNDDDSFSEILDIVGEVKKHYSHPLDYVITMRRQQEAGLIASRVQEHTGPVKFSLREGLSRITMNPITGVPILLAVLYWGLYKFVGELGAGVVVDFLEERVFERYVTPFVAGAAEAVIPWPVIQDLFVGEYGIVTLGIRYALALILPIVTMFFIVFSIIEDSGYLPRLAMLIDRVFKKIGLSGRAVIPMVLGLGCATMATMVTRTLPTKRERVISTMLLALAVPCSAQRGVIVALLGGRKLAVLIWAGVISMVFLLIGYLTAKILPGERPTFYMEVPPLRFPSISNIVVKTYARVKWYLKEVLPLFIFASIIIWAGRITGLFSIVIRFLEGPTKLLGLPAEAAHVFLFGFFRRDYGAAGLYDLSKDGSLSGVQLVVACITLTLFLPCVAQFLVNIKERGWKTAIAISVFVLLFSFTVGFAVNRVLTATGIVI
jgi:ferrous iron transport protein B